MNKIFFTNNPTLETYEKQEEILYILENEIRTKRPSKLYKLIIWFIHSEDIIYIFEGDTIYSNHNRIFHYIKFIACAGTVNELYNHLIEYY